ncbi:cytochrome c biogenesis protein DipZ [Mitsuaria sp. 7]|uniref:cytochrome c biogenesis protein DipZ n=1 Tax=Mitsuaria sp. 7 TaxID=1658665 RepID=UPI0007DD225F|nr:cytochrome c biogenesis protein DipZ [Mitsuaria sp. 7]ANH67417.1 cytochrome C biogenesis protein [Mitsuaria sp. 7]
MLLLLLTYLGGVLTIVSPCILPVLPFVFARAGQPFTRSVLPMLAGMALMFTLVATLAAVGGGWVVHANQAGRVLALVLMAVFALALLWPRLADLVARPFVAAGDRLSSSAQSAQTSGRGGPWSSLVLGIATGLLWAPCAGPILGLVLTTAALQGAGVHTSLLLLAYGLGAVTSLAVALLAGQRVFAAMKRNLGGGEWLRRGLGVAMLAGVAAIALGLDTGALSQLSVASTGGLEQRLLERLQNDGAPAAMAPQPQSAMMAAADTGNAMAPKNAMQGAMTGAMSGAMTGAMSGSAEGSGVAGGAMMMSGGHGGAGAGALPDLGGLPSLDGAVQWLNSKPLTAEALRGKVVLIDFWTYSCINCLRSLPYVKAWAEKYRDQGLVVIGVHAPEFAFERDVDNVRKAARDLGVGYPIAVDNNFAIWRAFANRYWPAHYFIDGQGRVRFKHFGEGEYAHSEAVIQQLLRENGSGRMDSGTVEVQAKGVESAGGRQEVSSPETYVGYERAERFASKPAAAHDQPGTYAAPAQLALNDWALDGTWRVGPQQATALKPQARVVYRFHARDLHLVLGSPAGTSVRFRVTLDGQRPGAAHGVDVDADGSGTVSGQRLYQLIRQGEGPLKDHGFSIEFLDPGVLVYAFTFG